MVTYEYPTNITDPYELVHFANELTGYWIGFALLMLIFSISFLSMKNGGHRTEECMVSSLWLTSVVAALLSFLPEMLDGRITLLLFIMTGLASVLLWRSPGS